MQKAKMAVLTVLSVVLMMSWVVPSIAADPEKVNINTATVEVLMTLDGIGEKYAKRIVAFRKKNGSFQKPEDLLLVKGIGRKIMDANVDTIIVNDD